MSLKPPKRTTVLALGSGITVLGVLRALSGTGVDVLALPDTDRATRRSRWYRTAPPALGGITPEMLADRLSALPEGTVLIPCSDTWARTVAALPADVLARYPASIAPLSALETLVDKSRFRNTLERLGLPHPTTRVVTVERDLDDVPDSVFQSSFLKPAHSQQFFARFGVKAFRTSDRSSALSRLADCLAGGFQMMVQEYIPGPPTNHYFIDGFVDRDGVIRALFARRRLRMSPPDFGNSTFQVSVPLGETGSAVATMKTLLADLRYRGIFSAEFKRDARNGEFNIIEVNARPWWYVDFAARCGVNVCELAIRDALGQSVESISGYDVGRRCVFPYYDLQAVRDERAAGTLGLLEWARSWLGPYQPVFRWSDPLPAVGEVAILIKERVRKFGKARRQN
jgi:predicted ATP-grasp superfamily ATP-dependent carboligase